jgi:Predicted integral membrane sensor domain
MERMLYLLLVVAYVVSGKLGILLAHEPGYASPIFPPAGIAIAAVFFLGGRALPWVLVGSLLLNGWIDYSTDHEFGRVGVIAAVMIAFASMLQAAVGGVALRRAISVSSDSTSGNIQHILRFLLLAPLICLVSASLSVSGLWLLGIIDAAHFSINWASWWMGDTFGLIVMFPLVLSAFIGPKAFWPSRVLTITAPALLVLSCGLAAMYFLQNAAIHSAHRIQLDDFGAQSRLITLRIEQRLEAYEQVLRGVRGLYIASPNVKRDEFHDYVSTLDLAKYYPGIQGVGFSAWVTPQMKADLIGGIL